jgi:Tfp pilus assembly protein PilN
MAATAACYLLPWLGCWLLYLSISQGLAWHRQQQLRQELTELSARVGVEQAPLAPAISPADHARQSADLQFANALIAKDRFSWTDLLDRLEKTLTKDVTLTRIEPDHEKRSLRLAGMAENVAALRKYLSSLLRSDSLANAFLLRQDARKIKDRYGREHTIVAFQLVIQKAF